MSLIKKGKVIYGVNVVWVKYFLCRGGLPSVAHTAGRWGMVLSPRDGSAWPWDRDKNFVGFFLTDFKGWEMQSRIERSEWLFYSVWDEKSVVFCGNDL